MNLNDKYMYKAFVGADNNTYSYVIASPDNKTVLASSLNPSHAPKLLYERRHLASLYALIGCLSKLQLLNIEDALITIDSKLNCEALNMDIDYTRFSVKYKNLIHRVRQMLLALNNVKLVFDYHNPIKYIIKNNVSFHDIQKEWDKIKSIKNDDVKNFIYHVDFKSAKDQYRIPAIEAIEIYCSGYHGYLSYIVQHKDVGKVDHVIELTEEQKNHSSKPQYLQIASVNLALDYIESKNLAKVWLYLSDMAFINQLKSVGKIAQQSKADILNLHQRLENSNIELIFMDKKENLARLAIKKLREYEHFKSISHT
ncbi:hypothetical protein [Paenibacillus sp. LK1]|uniref:hypothetical protein n=1 Tax=Paenibacillus sp. LK1 TaxID=2053014 RepID=UPI000C17D9E5|nr:hypothetical protein [Paenibacillus sp. LK1]PIH59699.1 hypothetical protein CS562_07095 [Paenibacillus sp. LK1]